MVPRPQPAQAVARHQIEHPVAKRTQGIEGCDRVPVPPLLARNGGGQVENQGLEIRCAAPPEVTHRALRLGPPAGHEQYPDPEGGDDGCRGLARRRADEPAWSPDGTTLAFTRPVNGGRGIWLAHADGGNERPLLSLPMHQFGAAWSPDGGLIAFTSTHTGRAEIFTAEASGNARPTQRTFDGATNSNPVWVVRR